MLRENKERHLKPRPTWGFSNCTRLSLRQMYCSERIRVYDSTTFVTQLPFVVTLFPRLLVHPESLHVHPESLHLLLSSSKIAISVVDQTLYPKWTQVAAPVSACGVHMRHIHLGVKSILLNSLTSMTRIDPASFDQWQGSVLLCAV